MLSRMRIRSTLLVPFAGLSAMCLAFLSVPSPKRCPVKAPSPHHPTVPLEDHTELLGLWQATTPEKEGDTVRFYYFHTGGIGLVRYGKMGLTYTRSFGWQVAEGDLVLVFTKTGTHHRVRFQLDGDALLLPTDPAFPGSHRYQRDVRPRSQDCGPLTPKTHPLARLWIEPTVDRKGSEGFRMYQLQAPTIDGRGVGWYHEGDMSDWSTETLTYRRTGDTIELVFPVRGERFSSEIRIDTSEPRTLTLAEDPRNFWHSRTYKDQGPGFTATVQGLPLPYMIPGHPPGRALEAGCKRDAP